MRLLLTVWSAMLKKCREENDEYLRQINNDLQIGDLKDSGMLPISILPASVFNAAEPTMNELLETLNS